MVVQLQYFGNYCSHLTNLLLCIKAPLCCLSTFEAQVILLQTCSESQQSLGVPMD